MPLDQTESLTQCDKKGTEVSLYLNVGDDVTVEGGSNCLTEIWIFHKGATGDLNLGETEDQEELSSRDPEQLVKQYTEGKIDLEISGEQVLDSMYIGNQFINSMRSGGYSRDVMILSGYLDEVGSQGWRGKFRNFDRSFTGPESGPGKQTFLLKPAACVQSTCRVRPVQVETAGSVEDYSPEEFTYI